MPRAMLYDVDTGCRIFLGLVFVAIAAIGIPFRLRADRAGGRVSVDVDPTWFWAGMTLVGPPLVLACLAFLIQPSWIEFAQMPVPGWLRWSGAPLALLGVLLFAWMFRHLGLNVTSTSMPRTQATLVTSGPYRWVRHPMYLAALVLAIATTLLTANLVVAIGGILMFALLAARSRVEEQRLMEKFGVAYRDYQHRTGRFVPRIKSGRRPAPK